MSAYIADAADNYAKFLDSPDGQIQKQILSQAILARLGNDHNQHILDAGCGSGWLTKILADHNFQAEGCDSSETLLDLARRDYPALKFSGADLEETLPYPSNNFDAVILNMAITDVADQTSVLKNLIAITKPNGRLLMTIPNPYYAYPVGLWKRGLLGRLLADKPILKLQSYFAAADGNRAITSNKKFSSRFYSLAETINHGLAAGWELHAFDEIRSMKDSSDFDLHYQLHRFPLFLLLDWVKKPLE